MKSIIAVFVVALVGCGPGARHDPHGGGDDDGPDASFDYGEENTPERCSDTFDNDGDGVGDCADSDCSGVGNCPVCGNVDNPEAQPLALPDGVSNGTACSTNAQCGGTTPNCVSGECHASYLSTLDFIGFPTNALLTDPSKLLKVCVEIEHSWLRDLQFELITPDNKVFILDKWFDRTTTQEIYLGAANDLDSAASPVPGTGMTYCWTATAPAEMINSTTGVVAPTTMMSGIHTVLSPGDYKTTTPWVQLTNTPLNGKWSMRVTDLWEIDNGFMFNWSITFDPSLIVDCSGPIIL